MFAKVAEERGPGWTRISKVKGHATQEMVDEGKVQGEQKRAATRQTLERKEAP